MNDVQWLVLDNVAKGKHYLTNLDSKLANEAFLWCIQNEYIRDGKITPAGELAMMQYQRDETR